MNRLVRVGIAGCCFIALAACNNAASEKPAPAPSAAAKPKVEKVKPADFFKAVSDNELEKVKSMLAQDPSLAKSTDNDLKETALGAASFSGKKEICEALIKAGADVNAHDSFGITPLIGPARTGHPDVIELLLNAKADINGVNTSGETALHYAARYKQVEAAKLLIARGANRALKDKSGKTALDSANEELKKDKGYKAIVDVLKAK